MFYKIIGYFCEISNNPRIDGTRKNTREFIINGMNEEYGEMSSYLFEVWNETMIGLN